MVAHLEPTLHEKGSWMYPRLFWETGVLGQVLYLEAHAVGISATGIGCFFDDPGIIVFLTSCFIWRVYFVLCVCMFVMHPLIQKFHFRDHAICNG